jgi:hypothetical protein
VIKKSERVSVGTTFAVPKIDGDGRRGMSMKHRGNDNASGKPVYCPILINPSWEAQDKIRDNCLNHDTAVKVTQTTRLTLRVKTPI